MISRRISRPELGFVLRFLGAIRSDGSRLIRSGFGFGRARSEVVILARIGGRRRSVLGGGGREVAHRGHRDGEVVDEAAPRVPGLLGRHRAQRPPDCAVALESRAERDLPDAVALPDAPLGLRVRELVPVLTQKIDRAMLNPVLIKKQANRP
jgi:hypothetical protein